MCGGLIVSPIPTFATSTPTVSESWGGSSYSDPTRNPVWQEMAPTEFGVASSDLLPFDPNY